MKRPARKAYRRTRTSRSSLLETSRKLFAENAEIRAERDRLQGEYGKVLGENMRLAGECKKSDEWNSQILREYQVRLRLADGVLDSLRREQKSFCDFKSDLMLLMASQWDVQCGSKLIDVKALQLLLKKYQGSDGLPSARDLDLDAEEKRIAEATKGK